MANITNTGAVYSCSSLAAMATENAVAKLDLTR